ncbi:LBA0864 family S-layer associated protein [Lactobacillus acetotolerans]|uniref:GW domain-containing protein n=1 Tax=Lactobacillus acetotolerans TaxID=1600 RepID=A0A5P5ZJ53_9LACO|nr:SH3-like domain-containing protein [Lactobacillus acetotolerans]KRN41576.1 bacterial Ig-like domain (group 3) [Lactobacillus acetotolerans DSM 20749 = JCM 3825]QFG51526.1 hypothetical protein LA749_05785 [Lactobacillus acetotolerans]GGV11818.1 hypothetical protein GCM10011628_06550 [Lactobacillus acetotolerans DSM 20749 = JCM 3825]
MKKSVKISLTVITLAIAAFLVVGISYNCVHAKSYKRAVTKIAGTKNYTVYHHVLKGGPAGKFTSTKYFKHGQIQSKKYATTKKGKYWYIIVDGRNVGWVNQNFFARNKISLAANVSLVRNSYYSFPTRDAINYATDSKGTEIDPQKVHVSESSINSSVPGTSKVKYSYGKAEAANTVTVRADEKEGISSADKFAMKAPKEVSTWKGSSKSASRHWNAAHDFGPETSSNTFKAKGLTLRTRLFQPRFVSLQYGQAADKMGQVGVVPEGITVKDNIFTVSMFYDGNDQHGHLVSYNLNHIKSKYAAQNLLALKWSTFKDYASHIRVSPYIKLGHGQSISSTGKYIYVLANNDKFKNSSASEEIMRIRKSDMKMDKIWTFKIWNKDAANQRYIHNATFANDHTMYALFHNGGNGRYEYWKVTRNGDTWTPTEIGATQTNFISNGSPVQGFTYDANHNQFYIAFNDYIFRVAENGSYKSRSHLKVRREIEGLSVSGSKLYVEFTKRPELTVGKTK